MYPPIFPKLKTALAIGTGVLTIVGAIYSENVIDFLQKYIFRQITK